MNADRQNNNRGGARDQGIGNAKYDEKLAIFKTLDGVPVRKLYVAKINTKIGRNGDQILKQAFSAYGEIQHIFFKDLSPVNKPSFAFVTYFSPKSAANAIQCRDMISIGHRRIFITPADSWHQPHENGDGTIIWDRRILGGFYSSLEQKEDEAEPENTVHEIVVQDAPIAALNGDVLIDIFSRLSLQERIAVGQVCQRWRDMNAMYWVKIKRLDFTIAPFDSVKLNDKNLGYFLYHCPFITHLNIATCDNELTSESIVAIAKQCPELEEIKIKNSELLKNRCCALLGQYCRKLTSFRCDDCSTKTFDHEFLAFLKKATQLETLYLKGVAKSSLWMVQLNPPLKSLTLDRFYMKSDIFLEAIQRLKDSLTELSIIYPADQYLYMSHVTDSLNLCQKLTSLTLNGILQVDPNDPSILRPLGELKDLKQLTLNRNLLVNDNLMEMISEKCTGLEHFSFCGLNNPYVTVKGLNLIANLENLKHLSLAFHYLLDDELLYKITRKLPKLEYLCLISCSQITSLGCKQALENCRDLAVLDVSNCPKINNSLVLDAIEDRKGADKKMLTIIAKDTKITVDKTMQPKERKIVKVTRESLENHNWFSERSNVFYAVEDGEEDCEDDDDFDTDDDSWLLDDDFEDFYDEDQDGFYFHPDFLVGLNDILLHGDFGNYEEEDDDSDCNDSSCSC